MFTRQSLLRRRALRPESNGKTGDDLTGTNVTDLPGSARPQIDGIELRRCPSLRQNAGPGLVAGANVEAADGTGINAHGPHRVQDPRVRWNLDGQDVPIAVGFVGPSRVEIVEDC